MCRREEFRREDTMQKIQQLYYSTAVRKQKQIIADPYILLVCHRLARGDGHMGESWQVWLGMVRS